MELIKTFRIGNNLGLHARTAAKIVEVVGQYRSQLVLMKGEKEVDGSNILSIITLACPKGSEIRARIVGEDARQLMDTLSDLFENNFGETA
ncbi:HPr family phosphocarrier protein [Thermodesulfobacteriota bacterium]